MAREPEEEPQTFTMPLLGALYSSLVIVAVVALGGIAAVRRRRRAPATAAADGEPGPRTKEAW